MATTIADLLDALDVETSNGTAGDPRDAAAVLAAIARCLARLRADGMASAPTSPRDAVARRLADECVTAAITFDQLPGRLSDLAGVTNDAVGILRNQLTDEDRWAIAINLATIARRCARAIAHSGPHTQIPQLLGVADRSRELLRTAALHPPDPEQLCGQIAPIPLGQLPAGLSPVRTVAEATADLVGVFRNRSRAPLTVRELIGVCRAAESIARHTAEFVARPRRSPSADQWLVAAFTWQQARLELSPFDHLRPPRGAVRQPVLQPAARVASGLVRTFCGPQPPTEHDVAYLRATAGLLPLLATGCSNEVSRQAHRLVAAGGPAPVNEDRVAEWLQHKAFLPTPSDLAPVLRAFATARLETDRAHRLANPPPRPQHRAPRVVHHGIGLSR